MHRHVDPSCKHVSIHYTHIYHAHTFRKEGRKEVKETSNFLMGWQREGEGFQGGKLKPILKIRTETSSRSMVVMGYIYLATQGADPTIGWTCFLELSTGSLVLSSALIFNMDKMGRGVKTESMPLTAEKIQILPATCAHPPHGWSGRLPRTPSPIKPSAISSPNPCHSQSLDCFLLWQNAGQTRLREGRVYLVYSLRSEREQELRGWN